MNVAITGAAGRVGREALLALCGHDVTPITHRDHDELEGPTLDVTDREAFAEALAGQDALVHLAGNPSPDADWESVFGPNVGGTYNAYEAARENDLDRVVFASSNHAVQMHNAADPAEPESLREDARTVRPDDPTRPDSYYGVSKVAAESLGDFYADRHGLEVVNLRIGWLMDEDELRETQTGDESEEAKRFARAMWLSPGDCREVVERAVDADLPESPVVAHAVSRNDDRYLSLTETMRKLDYRPRDDSAEAVEA
ncbi:NAD(P)-dependent oxidoreductase [Halorussus gelatinilyticus]|uniref:NAD(P)-dependent oxidoreductase n=1 Tax=Halorussus gelatinilyticus TaxID=2937524 RepID=A0A8U0IEZ7_9EURY|nr:NAD(P)-dependent oxidoreductase [Halorussus gelatinilyticus]UPV99324.1 NAD(P)-dependent oxidoreductase [Halorussus gelatinilyticus]